MQLSISAVHTQLDKSKMLAMWKNWTRGVAKTVRTRSSRVCRYEYFLPATKRRFAVISDRLVRLPDIIGQVEVTEEQARINRLNGRGPRRARRAIDGLLPVSRSTFYAGMLPEFILPLASWLAEDLLFGASVRSWLLYQTKMTKAFSVNPLVSCRHCFNDVTP